MSGLAVGSGVAEWFASILGTDATEGGYIAGTILVIALFAIGMIFSSRTKGGVIGLAGLVLIGAIFAWFMDWWPAATILVFGLFLGFAFVFGWKGASASDE